MDERWSFTRDPDTARLEDWAAARMPDPGGPPPTGPAAGQDRADWLAEVALSRARHDAAALAAGALFAPLIGPEPETWWAVKSSWERLAVADGAIDVRLYRPLEPGPHAGVVLVHGGAYWMGGGAAGFALNDPLCRQLATEVGAVVVSVDHRLAPEHPFPAPVEDTYAALEWLAANAGGLGVDPDRLAVFGISSGGNLVCQAAQLAISRGGPRLAAQVLQCPSLDLTINSSRFEATEAEIAGARRLVAMYLGASGADARQASPGLAPDLAGAPPTLLVVAEFDVLAPDALAYAARLEAAGLEVTTRRYPMTHTTAVPAVYRRMHAETAAWLAAALGESRAGV
ncbi:MAG: alpha/beta hydrolase [Bifidobacteriaceae bacterium]|jgi:acetyl esterase|nr:alpha/beta hydrolase [Bifidobacteriaceae bacterium]